jgi:uncharacterized membrane protein YkvA (DUF1232 family)
MWLTIVRQAKITWQLLRDNRVPIHAKLAFLLPLLYVISPIDLLPDFFVGVGQLDDLGIILIGIQLLQQLTPSDILQEIKSGVRQSTAPETVSINGHREETSYRNGVR